MGVVEKIHLQHIQYRAPLCSDIEKSFHKTHGKHYSL